MATILLTRAAKYNQKDNVFFRQRGFSVIEYPLTEISLLTEVFDDALTQQLNSCDWIFFTSQAPVTAIMTFMKQHQIAFPKIACIGRQTAATAANFGADITFIGSHATKSSLLTEWQALYGQTEGQLIFYPKSQLAQPIVLSKQQVIDRTVYHNQFSSASEIGLRQLLQTTYLDAVYVASPSAWQRFYQVYSQLSISIQQFYTIGTTTAACIEKAGFSSIILE